MIARCLSRGAVAAVLSSAVLLSGCGERAERADDDGMATAARAHAGVACGDCHTGDASGFAVGAAPPRACLECHAPESLPDSVALDGVRLAHVAHGDDERSLQLGCNGCHAHTAGDQEVDVTAGGCFLCHGPEPAGARPVDGLPAPGCRSCHTDPSRTALTPSGTPINHVAVVEQGISCTQCHFDVVRGSGAVVPGRCAGCHSRPDRPTAPAERPPADSIHRAHLVGDRSIACTRCHDRPSHETVALASAISLNCVNCHAQPHGLPLGPEAEWSAACLGCHEAAHRPQQRLYTGLGLEGTARHPARMFIARVACQSCHTTPAVTAAGAEGWLREINRSCVACHGAAYEWMLPEWTRAISWRVDSVAAFVAGAAGEAGLRADARTDSLVRAAARALALIAEGSGLHNIPAADALLRSALRDVEAAYQAAGRAAPPSPALGPSAAERSCAHCHYGVAAHEGAFAGRPFAHAAHVLRSDVPCGECHSRADYFQPGGRSLDPGHGQTTVTAAACTECHHVSEARPCGTCHAAEALATADIAVRLSIELRLAPSPITRDVEFRHENHRTLQCADCHAQRTDITRVANCSQCHADHHTEASSCVACHGTEVGDAHVVDHHFACTQCHERGTLELVSADRPFCLTCHAGREDHFPDGECASCHMQSSPAEIKARILEN